MIRVGGEGVGGAAGGVQPLPLFSSFSPKLSSGFRSSTRKTPTTTRAHTGPFSISLSDMVQPSGRLWMLLPHNHRRGNESLASRLHLPVFHLALQPLCPEAREALLKEFKENAFVRVLQEGEEASPGCRTCIASTSVCPRSLCSPPTLAAPFTGCAAI